MFPRVLTAVVTPFDNDGNVDVDSFLRVVKHSIDNNCGVVIFGTTGETSTISTIEKFDVLQKLSASDFPKDKIVIGVGGNDTKECKNNITIALSFDFTNVMVTTPYYNKASQEGLYQHFTTLAEYLKEKSGDEGKMIMYNVPPRTNVDLLPVTVKRIVDSYPNVVAIKEATGSVARMIDVKVACPQITLYTGDDTVIVPCMSVGGYGAISVLSNKYPDRIVSIVNACAENEYDYAMIEFEKVHKGAV